MKNSPVIIVSLILIAVSYSYHLQNNECKKLSQIIKKDSVNYKNMRLMDSVKCERVLADTVHFYLAQRNADLLDFSNYLHKVDQDLKALTK